MRNSQDTFETHKQSSDSSFSIFMTVPLMIDKLNWETHTSV